VSAPDRAPLVEVFHSVQGEGRFVGAPMAFVRVATCPIRCRYCDTPHSYVAAPALRVRGPSGERAEPNPATAARCAELVAEVDPAARGARRCSVSVTGGEPLVFPGFVSALGRELRARGRRLHLETAALDPDALASCVGVVDHLSADWKLPETLHEPPPEGDFGPSHLRCCELALAAGCSVDVKIVLTCAVTDASLGRALASLHLLRERILVVLQPVTPFGAETEPLPPAALQRFAAAAGDQGFDVRVLPQVHRLLQVP
jgi:organic radical activating enzyme